MATRQCPLCDQPPREGQEMRPIRIAEGEVPEKEPGLYSACEDCHDALRPKIAERLGKQPEHLTRNDFC